MLFLHEYRFSNLPPCYGVCFKVIGPGETQASIQTTTQISVVPKNSDFRI